MLKHRMLSIILLIIVFFVGYFFVMGKGSATGTGNFGTGTFKLGLDLNGGTELTYRADVSTVKSGSVSDAMASLRDVIERRINIFGVSEPIVAVENPGIVTGGSEHRLLVELPGVTDINQAIALIGKTPQLDFMLIRPEAKNFTEEELKTKTTAELFLPTGLGGQYLDGAQLQFTDTGGAQLAGEPIVSITFNSEGRELFADITSKHKGEVLAIFLDGQVISSPVIQDEIKDGKAIISGSFTRDEAKALVRDLNYGALPVPIELVRTQTIGASLGENAKTAGVKAGIVGFTLIVAFLLLWYRLPGGVASVSLCSYIILAWHISYKRICLDAWTRSSYLNVYSNHRIADISLCNRAEE